MDVEAKVEGAVKIPASDAEEATIIQAVVDSITGHLSKGQKSEPLRKLMGSIWRDGYKKKAIVGEYVFCVRLFKFKVVFGCPVI